MAKSKPSIALPSTEEKIKMAARILFTQKGFAETKTREIAEAAGINLALMNYYYRSKQKLYDIIMEENMTSFKKGIAELFGDKKLDVYEKIEKLTSMYIDEFIEHRDIPNFIITTIYNSDKQSAFINDEESISKSRKVFITQIQDLMISNKVKGIHPAHIISNLIGLILFPFAISPMLKQRANINDKEFVELMKERKKLIPMWLESMLGKK